MIKIKLKDYLDVCDISMYWLSDVTNITYPTIHKLATKKTQSISFETLDKICWALNCQIQDIIEYQENIIEPYTNDEMLKIIENKNKDDMIKGYKKVEEMINKRHNKKTSD